MGQEQAWIITLVLMAAVIVPFLVVAVRAGGEAQDYAAIQAGTGKIRFGLFWGLILLVTPVMVYSLTSLPYSASAESAAEPVRVNATGYQWYWEIDNTTVPAGHPVEFHVSSADVNHGFGIYDPDMQIVAQVQAMPGYTNVLRHTFDEPGTYKVLCLEYCGLVHHNMITEITVTSASAALQGGEL